MTHVKRKFYVGFLDKRYADTWVEAEGPTVELACQNAEAKLARSMEDDFVFVHPADVKILPEASSEKCCESHTPFCAGSVQVSR
jgi:hypothetical protein